MKKFARVLTLILSLILCFSLFGCETGTTTDQSGNLVPETPGGNTGDNNKPINLLDYFYETFENTDSIHYPGNIAPFLDDITFNEPLSSVYIKTKVAVFIETVTLDIGYNGKLTEASYYSPGIISTTTTEKSLDLDCSISTPVTYTYTVNRQFNADTLICFQIDCDDNYGETNRIYLDNLRIKLKLK